ncbi:MAG TPA: hypothetical protein VMV68_09280 [Spirochaetia bacterium]|nr:hypothetical protein [Spirochaetia bacterium]
MKDSLLLPFYFVGMFILLVLILTAGVLMYLWNVQYVPAAPPRLEWLLHTAWTAALQVFVFSIIGALLLSLIRVAHRPGVPILSFILLLVSSASVLFYGFSHLSAMTHGTDASESRIYNPIVPGVFNRLATATIFPESVAASSLRDIVVAEGTGDQALSFQASGSYDSANREVVYPNRTGATQISPENPNFGPLYTAAPFVASLVSDTLTLNRGLQRALASSRLLYLIACGGIILFAMGCTVFARLTRWPLLNAFLLLASFRALFWLDALFTAPSSASLISQVVPEAYLPVAPFLGLGAIAVLLILWQLLFVRRAG